MERHPFRHYQTNSNITQKIFAIQKVRLNSQGFCGVGRDPCLTKFREPLFFNHHLNEKPRLNSQGFYEVGRDPCLTKFREPHFF
jgi:hypothetical protein